MQQNECWMQTIFFLPVFDAGSFSASKEFQVPTTIVLKQKLYSHTGCSAKVAPPKFF